MPVKYLIAIALLLGGILGLAAQPYASLPTEMVEKLLTFKDDHQRADSLNEWAFLARTKDREQSWQLARVAMAVSEPIRYAKGRGDSYVVQGILAKNNGENELAEQFYLRAARIRDSIGDYLGVASCYNNLGNLRKQVSDYVAARDYFQRGLEVIAKLEAPDKLEATLCNNLGTSLKYLGAIEEAQREFQRSLEVAYALKAGAAVTSARFNLANLLQAPLEQYERARDSLLKCLGEYQAQNDLEGAATTYNMLGNNAFFTNNFETALRYYQDAIALETHLADSDKGVVYKNRGKVWLELGDTNKALTDFRTADTWFKKVNNQREQAGIAYEMGLVYFRQRNYAEAEQALQIALDQNEQDLQLESQILDLLAETQGHLGKYDVALRSQERYMALQDSFYYGYQRALQQDYTVKALESQNRQLHLQSQIASNRTLKFYGIIALLVLWILLGGAVVNAYFNRQKRQIAEQNELIAKQEVIELMRDRELESNYALLEMEEETRRKIGKDLHDGLGNILTTIKWNFSSIDTKIDNLQAENRERYDKANQLLDEAYESVRRISHEMSSAILTNFGLKAQLEAMADALNSAGKLKVDVATHGLRDRLNGKLELNIYRIVQELVNNVIKHAEAQKIDIQVYRFDDSINVLVEDDGVGFDPTLQKPGIGIKNLESRAHDLGGEVKIDSQPDKGTRVIIDLPVRQEEPYTSPVSGQEA